jgi:hypothetical protein
VTAVDRAARGVGAVLHHRPRRRIPPPLAEYLDTADRNGRIDRDGLGHLADEAGAVGPVLWCGAVRTDVAVDVPVVEHVEEAQAGRLDEATVHAQIRRAAVLALRGVDVDEHALVQTLVVGSGGRHHRRGDHQR